MTGHDDDELTEAEFCALVGCPIPKPAPVDLHPVYQIDARVKNHARSGGGNLTTQGVALCNSFTLILKEFYDFAETVKNKKSKAKLLKLIESKETVAGDLIAAFHSGIIK